jgi:DNA-directed RNA polymerase subunit N (RpoN/RPB10)
MKNLYVIPGILKPLQENVEKTLEDMGIDNYVLNRTLIAHNIRARIDKRHCIKF